MIPCWQCPPSYLLIPLFQRFSDYLNATLVAVALFSLLGCGPKSDLLEVTGEVSLNGAPVNSGSIRFTSVGTDRVSSTGAMIRGGEYSIPQVRGLLPGTYQIVISAADENAPKVMARDASGRPQIEVAQELIPAEYNTESEKTVDVTVDGENHFVFDIAK